MYETTNILVTGGAGFIGSHICEQLLLNGVKFIRILDNLFSGKMENIQHLLDKYNNVEFQWGDITNLDTCRKACENIDIICHQAAIGSVPRSIIDPLFSHNNNICGTFNIFLSAKENNIKRIVYASSSSVYGDNNELPKVEEKKGELLSPYALNKSVCELYGQIFTRCYGMECIGLRYFNIFGPRQDPNGSYAAVIPKFINLIKNNESPIINGDGSFSRDFTYIDNAVQSNIKALFTTNEIAYGKVFNIGTNNRVTILELFNNIKKTMASEIDVIFGKKRDGDIPHSHANIELAKKYLDYNPTVSFIDGLQKTIEYFDLYYQH